MWFQNGFSEAVLNTLFQVIVLQQNWHQWNIEKTRRFCLIVPSPHLLQLHITISPEKVKLHVDCQEVAEKPIKEANNITLDGYEVLGKMVKSGGGRRQSATVSEKRKPLRLKCKPLGEKTICLEQHLATFQIINILNCSHVDAQLSFNCSHKVSMFIVLWGTHCCLFSTVCIFMTNGSHL